MKALIKWLCGRIAALRSSLATATVKNDMSRTLRSAPHAICLARPFNQCFLRPDSQNGKQFHQRRNRFFIYKQALGVAS
jgi:hypothetical protein